MFARTLLTAAVFAAAVAPCQAQARDPARTDDKGTYLGVLFAPLSDAQYKNLKQLSRGQGVCVTQVLPNSPAAKAELQRDDIILTYDGKNVGGCEEFARLIINDKPDRTVKLTILRDGQEKTVEATLVLGPPLRLAAASKIADNTVPPKGISKPGGPDRVSVIATPLGDGKMKVTIEYYVEGRIQTVPCEGQPAEIDAQAAKKLPPRELEAVRAALDRIRSLTDPKPAESKKP
jgi:membrane-associated protease RseP (regulator of RpoE activity)